MFDPFKAVKLAPLPLKVVAASTPVLLLKVKFEPDLAPRSPVAAVANNGKQVVSLLSSATVTVVAIAAVPVVSWFSVATLAAAIVPVVTCEPLSAVSEDPSPLKAALVSRPLLGLYINPLSCLTAVNAPVVVLAKYNKKSVSVLVSLVIVAPAAAQLKVPDASLTKA